MIHGFCGIIDSECVYMKDMNDRYGQWCKANYLKQFYKEIVILEDRYPLYQPKTEVGTWYK